MNECAEVRTALGVYVLGAIEPAERSRVEAHLSGCPACRDDLASLAGLPALLSRVSEPQIEHVAGAPGELLESLLAKAAANRPRPRRWAPYALAASVVLIAGVLLGVLLGIPGGGTGPQAGQSPSQRPSISSTPALETVMAIDPVTHVKASITMDPRQWGTGLAISIAGAPAGTHCNLIVVDRQGKKDSAAGWKIESEGYGDFHGSTMFRRADIVSFRVVTTENRTLVTVPA